MHLNAYAVQLVVHQCRDACPLESGIWAGSSSRKHWLNADSHLQADGLQCFETARQQNGRRCSGRGHQHGGSAYRRNRNVEGSGESFLDRGLHRTLS